MNLRWTWQNTEPTPAIIHGRFAGEEHILGPHVFGRGTQFVEKMNKPEEENRALCMSMLDATAHVHMNSWFEKPACRKVTRRDDPLDDLPPYTPEKFAEIDNFIANRIMRNCVHDISSRPDLAFPSDHYLITADVTLKLREEKEFDHKQSWKGPPRPTNSVLKAFQEQVAEGLHIPDIF